MATIDGRPAQYGISLKQLRELMETRGREGVLKVSEIGGALELCNKLYTSPKDGKKRTNKKHALIYFQLIISTLMNYSIQFYFILQA